MNRAPVLRPPIADSELADTCLAFLSLLEMTVEEDEAKGKQAKH